MMQFKIITHTQLEQIFHSLRLLFCSLVCDPNFFNFYVEYQVCFFFFFLNF